jgi:hypothetical protein
MPRLAFIGGPWCCGSTALNISLIQHPSIAGCREETLGTRHLPPDWQTRPWVLVKNPQGALFIDKTLAQLKPDQLILLTRNPYAVCHSIVTNFRRTLRWACAHAAYYYVSLLEAEQQRPAGSTHRVRFEDVATDPAPVLTNLLRQAFGLSFDPRCLRWELREGDVRPGYGNPKVCTTRGWMAGPAHEWRGALSAADRHYVRNHLHELFRDLGYDPDDAGPKNRPAPGSVPQDGPRFPPLVGTQLWVQEGNEIVVMEEKDGPRLCTLDHAVRAAQALYAAYVPAEGRRTG